MRSTEGVALIAGAALFALSWWKRMKLINSIRGLRNKNPGNIERNGIVWDGMAEDQSGDERFVVFVSPEYGIRAMARLLASYKRQGVDTVAEIIERWAPASENHTAAYIRSVTSRAGMEPFEEVTPEDYPLVIAAIIHHENGINPYSMALINRGVSMA